MYNPKKARESQSELQKEKVFPAFAPKNGMCWSCHNDIYKPITTTNGDIIYITGITLKSAAENLVTGCPHCRKSYCDWWLANKHQ